MSTPYFVLTKDSKDPVHQNDKNQIFSFHKSLSYLLPETNIEYYLRHGLFESDLISWSQQFCSKDGIFLDIGAHTGTYAISLADFCSEVYAFEPQKMTYYALCGSVALSNKQNITCIPIALGSPEQCGKMTLKIRSPDGGGSSVFAIEGHPVLREEIIDIQTLDAMFGQEEHPKKRICFVKMDVEYNELYVLQGAVNTLRQHQYPPILFEANANAHSETQTELFTFLETTLPYQIVRVDGSENMFLAMKTIF